MKRCLVAGVVLTLVGAASAPALAAHPAPREVVVSLRMPSGAEAGTASLTSVRGGTRIRADVRGLTPGFHGFHLHAVAVCDGAGSPAFASAGGHYARTGQAHGDHAGDLPPLLVAADGTARADVVSDGFTLAELFDHEGAQGAALVVHAAPDNLANVPARYRHGAFRPAEAGPDAATLATGDSGGRVACGVVGSSAEAAAAAPRPAGEAGAQARMRTAAGADAGVLTVRQLADRVEVRGSLASLTPGFHGFHVHAVGACDGSAPTPFSSAGGHLNPGGAGHGQHDGDLPALRVLADGTATVDLDSDTVTVDELFDGDGAALIVHTGPDNLANIPTRYRHGAFGAGQAGPDAATLATGDSGGRVLCGVLENSAGAYRAVPQRRLLDTRRAGGPLGPGRSVDVRVPSDAPAAPRLALLTLTVIGPSADTALTTAAAGARRPAAPSAVARRGQVVATTVLAPLNATGNITITNAAGSTHLTVDVLGVYTSETPLGTGRYHAVSPARLGLRTVRAGSGQRIALTGSAGVPTTDVSGVVITLTATRPSASTHLTVGPGGAGPRETSVLNLRPGQTRAATVVAPVAPDGTVLLRNAAGVVDVLVDVVGWYAASASAGGRHIPLPPYLVRSVDTDPPPRAALSLGPGQTRDVVLAGVGGIPSRGARAVVLGVTATGTTRRSHLVAYPAGIPLPATSNLNWAAGESLTTTVVTPLGQGGAIRLFNAAGSVQPRIVVLGYVDAG